MRHLCVAQPRAAEDLDPLAQGPSPASLVTGRAAYTERALDLRHERNMRFSAATLPNPRRSVRTSTMA